MVKQFKRSKTALKSSSENTLEKPDVSLKSSKLPSFSSSNNNNNNKKKKEKALKASSIDPSVPEKDNKNHDHTLGKNEEDIDDEEALIRAISRPRPSSKKGFNKMDHDKTTKDNEGEGEEKDGDDNFSGDDDDNRKGGRKWKEAFGRRSSLEPRVVRIRHLPIGFFEKQLRSFFSQFTFVKRVRVGRSLKTGKSRNIAFVEFGSSDIAKAIVSEMDNYELGGKHMKLDLYNKKSLPYPLNNKAKQNELIQMSTRNVKGIQQRKALRQEYLQKHILLTTKIPKKLEQMRRRRLIRDQKRRKKLEEAGIHFSLN